MRCDACNKEFGLSDLQQEGGRVLCKQCHSLDQEAVRRVTAVRNQAEAVRNKPIHQTITVSNKKHSDYGLAFIIGGSVLVALHIFGLLVFLVFLAVSKSHIDGVTIGICFGVLISGMFSGLLLYSFGNWMDAVLDNLRKLNSERQ